MRRLSEGCSGTCSQPVGGTVCPCVCPWPRDRERCANRCGMGKGGGEACECIPFLAAVGSERHSLCAGPRVAHGIQARSPPLEEISVSCSSFSKARAFHVVGAQCKKLPPPVGSPYRICVVPVAVAVAVARSKCKLT